MFCTLISPSVQVEKFVPVVACKQQQAQSACETVGVIVMLLIHAVLPVSLYLLWRVIEGYRGKRPWLLIFFAWVDAT